MESGVRRLQAAWRGLAVALSGVAVVAAAALCRLALSDHHLYARHGWDALLYCQAAATDAAGENPYVSLAFPFQLPWLYPPALLNMFRGLCAPPLHFASLYPLLYLVVVAVCVLIWSPRREWPLAMGAVVAFGGLSWSLLTGNLDMALLLPVSLAFYALAHERWHVAAIFLGFTAATKILPLVYLPLIFLAPTSWKNRWSALATGVAAFVIIGGALTFSRPELAPWFFRQLAGAIPGQQNPATEFGGALNPAFPYLVAALAGRPNDLSAILPGVAVAAVIVGLGAVFVYRAILPAVAADDKFALTFALAFLAVHLLLPRLKPYSFVLLTPALFWLLRRQSSAVQCAIVTAGALYPAWAVYLFLHRTEQPMLPLLFEYGQQISLLAVLSLVMAAEFARARSAPAPLTR